MKTRQSKRLRQPARYEGGIPQYSLGGILASTAAGAGTGAIGGGGVLSLPGALIGGGVGLVTGLFDHFKEKKEERREERANLALGQASGAVQANAGGSMNNYINPWMAAKGGVVGGRGGNLVKLRNKEMLLGPDNTAVSTEQLGINTPEHTNKGVVALEDGTIIVSPENSKQAKVIAKRQEPEVKRLNKILENTRSTPLARKTAERRLAALKQEYMPLIIADAQNRIQQGGNVEGEAALGDIIKGAGKWLSSDEGRGVLSNLGSLVPVGYNLMRAGQPAEQLNPAAFQNPMAYDALQSMRNRQPILTPALQAADSAVAAGEANLRSAATGRGQYAAGRVALGNAAMANKANIYAQGNQMRNQYLGEYGQMQAGIGQKMADTNLIVSDLNARNLAAKRQFGAAAAGQIGQYAQNRQLMANQASRDRVLSDLYKGWMKMFERGGSGVPPVSNQELYPNEYND